MSCRPCNRVARDVPMPSTNWPVPWVALDVAISDWRLVVKGTEDGVDVLVTCEGLWAGALFVPRELLSVFGSALIDADTYLRARGKAREREAKP